MLQMHLPMGAIRHKMSASGFTDAEIEAFASNTSVSSSSTNSRPTSETRTEETSDTRETSGTNKTSHLFEEEEARKDLPQLQDLLASIQGFNKKKLKRRVHPRGKNLARGSQPKTVWLQCFKPNSKLVRCVYESVSPPTKSNVLHWHRENVWNRRGDLRLLLVRRMMTGDS